MSSSKLWSTLHQRRAFINVAAANKNLRGVAPDEDENYNYVELDEILEMESYIKSADFVTYDFEMTGQPKDDETIQNKIGSNCHWVP